MIKLISMKDGNFGDRGYAGFSGYSPCTWRAVNEAGEMVAEFVQTHRIHGKPSSGICWFGDGQIFDYLVDHHSGSSVRAHVRQMNLEGRLSMAMELELEKRRTSSTWAGVRCITK